MVISQPPRIISILSCFTNAASIALNIKRHLMFYTCNYNIRVTHRNGAIKHIFTRIRSTEGSSADCSLFILSLHALALHLAVKYYFKSFCMKIWARWPYIHLSVVFPQCQQDLHFVTQQYNAVRNILAIWHKSSSKTQGQDPDWNDKNDNANYAPSYHMEGFYQWLRCVLKIFDQVRKDLDWIVLFWTKTSQRLTLCYYLL